MTSIRTTNARRRARERRALGRDVIQSWECYVDDMDARKVHLVMHDLTTDRSGDREHGSFPRRLFSHIDVRPGLILIVDVLRCRRIEIRTVPRDPDAPDVGAELVELLAQLREEDDKRTDSGDAPTITQGSCQTCGRALAAADDPLSRDCGGDCWGCVGQIEADDGYEPSMMQVEAERRSGVRPASN